MSKPNHGSYEFDAAWQQLIHMAKRLTQVPLTDLFTQDPNRYESFSLNATTIHLDYSKNHINHRVFECLVDLAKHCQLEKAVDQLMSGQIVNQSEQRSAWHTALRSLDHPEVIGLRQKLAAIALKIQNKQHLGATGKPITNVVHIGIGGSFLGPKLVHHALAACHEKKVNCHFIANIDAHQIERVLKPLDPESTLFIIASKSFSTLETMTNANSAKHWLQQNNIDNIEQHFIAITNNQAAAIDFGVQPNNCLDLWEWVGGRYSLWSSIGLINCIEYGFDNYKQLLAGAREMDNHFKEAPLAQNMPVILALLDIWNHNFLHFSSHGIIPYNHALRLLPAYLQQLDMESLGKSVDQQGNHIDYPTGNLIWGAEGTNGQHAFHQWLHQGSEHSTLDFLLCLNSQQNFKDHQNWLIANCLAQTQALMQGVSQEQSEQQLVKNGYSPEQAKQLAPHKMTPGNRPSNTLIVDDLSPKSIGSLLALYEHKVYVQSVILNINAFDQWGVELGKQLSKPIYQVLSDANHHSNNLDSSTINLIKYCQAHAKK